MSPVSYVKASHVGSRLWADDKTLLCQLRFAINPFVETDLVECRKNFFMISIFDYTQSTGENVCTSLLTAGQTPCSHSLQSEVSTIVPAAGDHDKLFNKIFIFKCQG